MSNSSNRWQKYDLGHIAERLQEVKALLEQAAALGAAQDTQKIEALAETEQQLRSKRGNPRRRYR